jgi:hypothetical protein
MPVPSGRVARSKTDLQRRKTEQQAREVWECVRALASFKKEIGDRVRDTFSNPADLADKAGSAVAKWLLKQKDEQKRGELAQRALQDLMGTVAAHLQEGNAELALTYLEDAASKAAPENLAAIADRRLEIAVITYSPNEKALQSAANEVLKHGGTRQVEALRTLGKCKSQVARGLWPKQPDQAWPLAEEARQHLEAAIAAEPINPDTYGTLGGLLKRMATWAAKTDPDRARQLEDAILDAYERGGKSSLHAYPLLNYLSTRSTPSPPPISTKSSRGSFKPARSAGAAKTRTSFRPSLSSGREACSRRS